MASKINYFFDYFRYLENPVDCLLFKFGLKNSCIAKPKYYDETFEISHVPAINNLMECISSDHLINSEGAFNFIKEYGTGKDIIEWENLKILNKNAGVFLENYLRGSWGEIGINYNNRTVIDIGANVGDTALFFAKNGAEVYGFEPVKDLYNISLQNIELNQSLKDKIHIFNYGVSYKRGKLNIEEMRSTSGYTNDKDKYSVDIITIDDILNKYDVRQDILKIDCEGCEFGIIENCDLSGFNDIIFEHHAVMVDSDYILLTEKLENEGFKIKKYNVFSIDFNDVGIIHAYK